MFPLYTYPPYAIIAASDSLTAVLVFLGVMATAGGSVVIARRAKSGKIDTTEATELWQAATEIRQELRAEVAALRADVKDLKDENRALKTESARVKAENTNLRDRLDTQDGLIEDLRSHEATLRARIMELEQTHG